MELEEGRTVQYLLGYEGKGDRPIRLSFRPFPQKKDTVEDMGIIALRLGLGITKRILEISENTLHHGMIMRLLFVFLSSFPPSLTSDPVEGLLRNVLLSIRGVGEKVLSSIPIPNSNDFMSGPSAAFSMDDKSTYAVKSFGEFLNTCPASLPVPLLSGSWHVTYVNRKWMQTILADLDEVIDLLASGQRLPVRKSLGSIFSRDLQISCLKMEFLNDNAASRFEISYLKNGRRMSLIGDVLRDVDKSLQFSFGPSLNTKMIVAYSTDHPSPSPFDVLVISQIDFFPKCENHLVLQRTRGSSRILEILNAMGANFPSNPLVEIYCEQIPDANNAIIQPMNPPIIKPKSSNIIN
ncbi:hypothetical protein RB195_013013 [Necator americanus]|uniref:Uncharacterized protein n=1 Tax=Necator americanus TaxID=51031 RepID=A0ABR1DU30_NECAM